MTDADATVGEATEMAPRAAGGEPIVVAGGGMVGTAMALALARVGASVTLVDASPPEGARTDPRPIALSRGSRSILAGLDVWAPIARRAEPIERIVVSERGTFAKVRLRADEARVDAFGHVLPAGEVASALDAALAGQSGVTRVDGARVATTGINGNGRSCEVEGEGTSRTVDTPLLIAADGGASSLRDALGIRTRTVTFDQHAIAARVTPRRPHGRTAHERFTRDGPLALLPLRGGELGLVWCMTAEQAAERGDLDDRAFLDALEAHAGPWSGGFSSVSRRFTFPLEARHARRVTGERLVLVGNAANQLHPVAGQGLNLALRDVARVQSVVAGALRAGDDVGAPHVVSRYDRAGREDRCRTAAATNAMARGFTAQLLPAAALRRTGLAALAASPLLRRGFAEAAMGLDMLEPPRLSGARG